MELTREMGLRDDSLDLPSSQMYTIILLKSVCRRSQTAGRNSCSIFSGDVSNGPYLLKAYPVTSSHFSSV